jgi:hypothetical protein
MHSAERVGSRHLVLLPYKLQVLNFIIVIWNLGIIKWEQVLSVLVLHGLLVHLPKDVHVVTIAFLEFICKKNVLYIQYLVYIES